VLPDTSSQRFRHLVIRAFGSAGTLAGDFSICHRSASKKDQVAPSHVFFRASSAYPSKKTAGKMPALQGQNVSTL
jgi:hypothetical protein